MKIWPRSHNIMNMWLCVCRDNVEKILVGLLSCANVVGRYIAVVDGILPV